MSLPKTIIFQDCFMIKDIVFNIDSFPYDLLCELVLRIQEQLHVISIQIALLKMFCSEPQLLFPVIYIVAWFPTVNFLPLPIFAVVILIFFQ